MVHVIHEWPGPFAHGLDYWLDCPFTNNTIPTSDQLTNCNGKDDKATLYLTDPYHSWH